MIKANDPNLKSWIPVKEGSDFPIQNLPFGIFKSTDSSSRAATAIGDLALDLNALNRLGFLDTLDLPSDIFNQSSLNSFIDLGKELTRNVRVRLSELLEDINPELRDQKDLHDQLFFPLRDITMLMPVEVGDYTDFYSSEQHAFNVGSMFRDPENALLPNWKHMPVAYHGRASSIVESGIPIHRPKGQMKSEGSEHSVFGATAKLDFELEMAFITSSGNTLGEPISIEEAEDHIFGMVLFNDWSARDIQKWEYVPLGPFLAKNFASSISPWIVTLDALTPFRVVGPKQDPEVLPYLKLEGKHNFDINLEVYLKPENGEEIKVTRSNFRHMYWNISQQLAHHTVNGCNMRTGDMYASGTISGPTPDSYGSMLELAWKGTKPIKMSDGSERSFIEDGDTIIMKGYAENKEVRIGFGEVSTKVLPARNKL